MIRQCIRRMLLTAGIAVAFASVAQAQTADAPTAVAEFHRTLFRAAQEFATAGGAAVDLYWKADAIAGFRGSRPELNSKLAPLYDAVGGERIARASLSDAGWTVSPPKSRLVVTESVLFAPILLLANHTSLAQSVAVAVTGGAWQQKLVLEAGEVRAVFPQLVATRTGTMRVVIQISGPSDAALPFELEVRPEVRLRVRVLDADGNATPARICLRAADGLSHVPASAFDRVMWMTGEHYFYSSGEFVVNVPAGKTELEVRKGFDYRPAVRSLDLHPGQPAEIDVRLSWLHNAAADGWYSGDDHIHNNYTGEQWSTPADARLAAAAEGLHVANLMVSNSTGGTVHDERYFEGKLNALSTSDELLYWSQEMRTWSYGHMLLLGQKELVRPLYTGFPGAQFPEDYPPNYVKAQQARELGGVALYAHPALQFDQVPSGSLAGEAVADVALGDIDGFEVFCSHDEPSMELWYRFLNLGFRLAISGGSDAFLNQQFAFLAGGERVYVYTGNDFTYANWIDGLRQGHSFATVGPVLSFAVDGRIPGSEISFGSAQAAVSAHVSAVSSLPMTRVEIVANGRVVAKTESPQSSSRLEWSGSIPVTESGWIAARIWGPNNDRIANGPSRWSQRRSPSEALLAHTSPVYVTVNGRRAFSQADLDFCLRWLDALTERIRTKGNFAGDSHRDEVLAGFARARQIYERLGMTAKKANP